MKPKDVHNLNSLSEHLSRLERLHGSLPAVPYSIPLRLQLARAYQALGYPDLAAGDAYRALLLIDEAVQDGEYHDQAIEAARDDIEVRSDHLGLVDFLSEAERVDHSTCCCITGIVSPGFLSTAEDPLFWVTTCWSKTAYAVLVQCLIDCGSLQSAFDYNSRATVAFPDVKVFQSLKEILTEKLCSYFESKGLNWEDVEIQDYPDKGLVRRELYPWNSHEPDRYSADTLRFLNDEMAAVAPKLEVRVTDLPMLSANNSFSGEDALNASSTAVQTVKQLGVFAKEDVLPGELILEEKSLLTAIGRLRESFCDACSASLPKWSETGAQSDRQAVPISCEDCEEVFFCSAACQDLATTTYHPALCGASINLEGVPANEAADALYTLLLVRALAMSETLGIHPLDLKEVKFIWGDYHGRDLVEYWKCNSAGLPLDPFGGLPRTLPFSFNANILRPLHQLEKMDVNIFEQSHKYDFWIFNTLYAKFRGTASARQGPDGRPDVGAVHPLWCLANHSCDPNVRWEWQGRMRFWARQTLVEWEGRPATEAPGIRKGQEIMGHYCDVELPVKERREWAIGALGGNCMCRRCLWEEKAKEISRDCPAV